MENRDCSGEPIGIAGGGRVGQALGRLLHDGGEPVAAVACRSSEHAARAAAFIGTGVEPAAYAELAARARRILICVPDEALECIAGLLQPDGGAALHTCGARGAEALEPLRARGVSCGTLHPLQTIADPAAGVCALRGVAFAVSGDGPAVAWARRIAWLAGGQVLQIPAGCRPLYHAAAVMASNYVTALLAAAQEIMTAAGVASSDAWRALAPLARTSLDNTLRLGPVQALTGPIERGDAATVAAHRAALGPVPGPVPELYRAAGLQTLEIAVRRGLGAEGAAAVGRVLQ